MSENEGADRAPDAEAPADPESTDDQERSTGEEARDRPAADETDPSAAADGAERSASGDGAEASSDAGAAEPGADEVEGDADADGADGDAGGSLAERVDDASTDQLAGEIAALRDRVETLERAVDDREETIEELESKLKRKQADFQNFKKRQERKREEERQRATEDLVERLLDVRDNLVRALDQEEGSDIRGGVETTLRQFDRVFDAEDVRPIDPEPGAAVDPGRHEVLMRVESDQEAGTVADIHRPGYEMAGKVLRPAQVTVAAEAEDAADDGEEDIADARAEDVPDDGDEDAADGGDEDTTDDGTEAAADDDG